jgi:prepilin-type N-terminal cleavage/methylation domain-containing protein
MRLHRAPARRRGGFTLVELLVVIAIIAVLVSLLSSAVFSAFVKFDEVKTRREISAMAAGLKQFESDRKISVAPPSRLYLDETGVYNPASNYPGYAGLNAAQQAQINQMAVDSKAYLVMAWPRIATGNPAQPVAQIDWNSSGVIDNTPYVLEGEQCLVFFLGGAKSGGVFVGFSGTNASNPMETTSTTKRQGPYLQFEMNRVTPAPAPGTFPVYQDTYGTAYAYFSSGTGQNKYDAYASFGHDCNSLTTMAPYSNGTQFYNADTFQIVSAGRDQKFGAGGQWASSDGFTGPATINGGGDNITNFYDAKLGVAP